MTLGDAPLGEAAVSSTSRDQGQGREGALALALASAPHAGLRSAPGDEQERRNAFPLTCIHMFLMWFPDGHLFKTIYKTTAYMYVSMYD